MINCCFASKCISFVTTYNFLFPMPTYFDAQCVYYKLCVHIFCILPMDVAGLRFLHSQNLVQLLLNPLIGLLAHVGAVLHCIDIIDARLFWGHPISICTSNLRTSFCWNGISFFLPFQWHKVPQRNHKGAQRGLLFAIRCDSWAKRRVHLFKTKRRFVVTKDK